MAGVFVILLTMGNRHVKKFIKETLLNPKTNQWSRKNVAGAASMGYAMFYAFDGMVREKSVQEFVVAIFVGASLACLGISSWEKINIKPPPDPPS